MAFDPSKIFQFLGSMGSLLGGVGAVQGSRGGYGGSGPPPWQAYYHGQKRSDAPGADPKYHDNPGWQASWENQYDAQRAGGIGGAEATIQNLITQSTREQRLADQKAFGEQGIELEGQQQRQATELHAERLNKLYPGTNPWERLGGNPAGYQVQTPSVPKGSSLDIVC